MKAYLIHTQFLTFTIGTLLLGIAPAVLSKQPIFLLVMADDMG